MGRRRRLLPSLTAAAVLLACAACRRDRTHASTGAPGADRSPELRMQGMTVQNWGPDGLEWEMRSPVGEGFTTRNFVQVSSMSVQLYEKGQRSTEISAEHAIMATSGGGKEPPIVPEPGVVLSSGDMFLNGNVLVVSTDGSRLNTDWVRYSVREKIIRSSAPVSVERDDSVTTGKGLEASSDLSSLKIFNQKLVIRDRKKP